MDASGFALSQLQEKTPRKAQSPHPVQSRECFAPSPGSSHRELPGPCPQASPGSSTTRQSKVTRAAASRSAALGFHQLKLMLTREALLHHEDFKAGSAVPQFTPQLRFSVLWGNPNSPNNSGVKGRSADTCSQEKCACQCYWRGEHETKSKAALSPAISCSHGLRLPYKSHLHSTQRGINPSLGPQHPKGD